MKNLKFIFLSICAVASLVSCIDDDNDALTGDKNVGGLVNVGNPLISYVVGSGNTYSAAGTVYQGGVQTTSIDVYKTFTNNVTGTSSNRELLTSIPISNTIVGALVSFSLEFTYESLISGLTLGGSPLPTDDGGLNIGDFWSLEYVGNTTAGTSNQTGTFTKVAVGTRYAGIYTVMESAYWNSGSFQSNWNSSDRVIESVDATIYKHINVGPWDDPTNEFYFTVDNNTGYITILPDDLAGEGTLLNGSPIMTCEGGPGPFESIPCDATTSAATPNDVTGEDQLEFTVGYHRGTGATREFYEKLVKQVD